MSTKSTDSPSTIEPMTEAEGGALLEGLLFRSPEDKSPTREKEVSSADEKDESAEQPDDTEEDSEQESESEGGDESEAEDDKSEDADESDEESDEDAEGTPEAKYTVKVDGAEEQVTLKEALAGYSRTAHFTRNSQKLAEDRKSFDGEKTAVTAERQQYATLLGQIETALKDMQTEPNWDQLRREDPNEYLLQKDEWDQQQKRISAVAEERKKTEAKLAEDQKAQLVEHLKAEHSALLEAVPEWQDQTKFAPEFKALREYALTAGFSEQDFDSISSHRVVLLLRKAMQFDAAKGKAPKVKPAPKTPTAKPGARPPKGKSGKATRLQEGKARLAKTGTMKDAAQVFGSLLFGDE